MKDLAEGAWRVRLGYERAGADGPAREVDVPEGWAGTLAVTGRVGFERRAGRRWRAAGLAEVPPPVFSEGMRDVDLFVSVASVAADPPGKPAAPPRTGAPGTPPRPPP